MKKLKGLLENKPLWQKLAIITGSALGTALLAVVLFYAVVIISFLLMHHPGYGEWGHYDNFGQYREQFDIVKDYFEDCGEGVYFLDMDGATDVDHNPLLMTEEQSAALYTVQSNCRYYEFDCAYVTEDYVWFCYTDYGCGIMYTDERIRRITRQLER
ncbi:MAG: hypothetical protein E7559_09185, partial [Ruminococcaceae bacterium]|nr:hypothetical protein [Oscillospiraceae bacterium]